MCGCYTDPVSGCGDTIEYRLEFQIEYSKIGGMSGENNQTLNMTEVYTAIITLISQYP